jgi:site-specific recombinase XerC
MCPGTSAAFPALDCVHEVPCSGAWLKVPLGKLLTERMVPIDEETVEIIDRITEHRSPGRPLRHPRTGKMADFLLTHQGRRISAETIREELHRAAAEAGLDGGRSHMLRHTYATALVNAGCSLQALMALLGHVSAAMSLRYGRLFDATVRDEYQRALILAKAQLGPVLPADRTAIRGTRLYITDGGDVAPHDSKLQEARINLAALLDPAAETR